MPLSSGCLFIHIPKCAGTSVEVALGVAAAYPNIGLEPTATKPDPSRLFGAGLQHLTLREIRRDYAHLIDQRELFSFSIVRDPVDRFVSHFLWKRHRFLDSPVDAVEVAALLAEIEPLVALSKRMDVFRWPLDGIEYRGSDETCFPVDDVRRHALPQCAYLFDDGVVPLDAIYPFEAIDALESDLRARGIIRSPLPRRMVGRGTRMLRETIPASAERAIQEVYRHDVRLHAYVRETAVRHHRGFCPGAVLTPTQLTGSDAPAVSPQI